MASLKWAITCQRVIIDQASNLVSYIDAVEELNVPALPFPTLPVEVGTVWDRQSVGETIDVRVRVQDPQRNIVGEIEARLQSPDKIRHRANFTVGLTARIPGEHRFVVEQLVEGEWRTEDEVVVMVSVSALAEGEPDVSEKQEAPVATSARKTAGQKRR